MTTGQRQLLMTLLGNFILWTVLGQVNHYLGSWQWRLWLGGLLIAPAAMRLDFGVGAAAAFLTGLALDAAAPVAFGTQALLLLAAHTVIFQVRNRLARGDTPVNLLVALFANLGLFLALSFTQIASVPVPGHAWLRLFADLLASQAAVALLTPWFFALHARALWLAGVGLRRESGGPVA